MRKPTDLDAALQWWRDTVAGLRPPHVVDDPQPGYFYTRKKKDGPRIPVEIRIEQEIDPDTGELAAPETLWAHVEGRRIPAAAMWEKVKAISHDEWYALHQMARDNRETMQATRVAMDPLKMSFRPPRRTL